jgi:D-sedoheptulose 7-phosphate isomerase
MTFFPAKQYPGAGPYASDYFDLYAKGSASVDRDAISRAGALLADTVARGAMIYSCGNGGSAAIANHLVCDCMKGVRSGSTLKPKVHSLSATIELITAIVNDIGSDDMFSYQLESLGSVGDTLIAISSSGASPNIIKALNWAKANGMATIAMTGFGGGDAAKIADVSLHVAINNYGVVEDIHQSLMHILAQYLRVSHFEDVSQLGQVKF